MGAGLKDRSGEPGSRSELRKGNRAERNARVRLETCDCGRKKVVIRLRLCRLMCGKAPPYRSSSPLDPGGYASDSRRSLSNPREAIDGKAQPFRTSGGGAANTSSNHS